MYGLDNPLTRAMAYYDFDRDTVSALEQMTEAEIKYVIEHETGEVKAGKLLAESWNDMLVHYKQSQAEIMLRALRDHLADSLTTLPALLSDNQAASIHFYFGNMTAMRKHLAPALMTAYDKWHETGKLELLEKVAMRSGQHWRQLADDVKTLYSESADARALETLISSTRL